MKIMIVAPYFYPKIGGLENYALQVAKCLIEQNHQVFVVTSNHVSKEYIEETVDGLRIIRLPIQFKLSNSPFSVSWYIQLKKIINSERPDVINAHSPVPFLADFCFAARGKTPFVITYHSGSMKKGSSIVDLALGIYENTLLKRMLKKSDEIISVYPDFIKKLAGNLPLHYIPPGVNTAKFRPSKAVMRKKETVLYVGRVERSSAWKGIGILFESMKILNETMPNIQLQIVGDGDAIDDFKLMAKNLGISKNVSFSGVLRGEALTRAYQSASLLALPSTSDSEAFGTVLIEAMACGTPVIASDIGGMPSVVNGGAGLLTIPGDSIDLADKIKSILINKTLQNSLSDNGLAAVHNKFSVDLTLQKTNQVLTRAANPSIVHVSAYYPPHLGGMEQVVKSLAVHEYANRNVKVVSSKSDYILPYKDEFPVIRLSAFEVAHTPIMPLLLLKLLSVSKNKLVHVHVAQAYTPEIVWLASKLKGFRYIAHMHLDVAPSGPFGKFLEIYKSIFLKQVLKSARGVIVFTKDQKQLYIAKYGLEPSVISIIPNGAEAAFYLNKKRNLPKLPKLLFVGRLSQQKNLEQLLHSLDGISHLVQTIIVGTGDTEIKLRKLIQKLGLINISLVGRADGKTLVDYYKTCDIFVLPSEREGMPLVLLEALAARLPVIATEVTGNTAVIKNGRNGLLVPLNDATAMRAAIVEITSNAELYAQLSKGAGASAIQYSWPEITKKVESLYSEVML